MSAKQKFDLPDEKTYSTFHNSPTINILLKVENENILNWILFLIRLKFWIKTRWKDWSELLVRFKCFEILRFEKTTFETFRISGFWWKFKLNVFFQIFFSVCEFFHRCLAWRNQTCCCWDEWVSFEKQIKQTWFFWSFRTTKILMQRPKSLRVSFCFPLSIYSTRLPNFVLEEIQSQCT